jgi:hypothetical protein
MAYIIRRNDQGGGYVAPIGSAHSYVRNPDHARQYGSEDAAKRDKCDNETVCEFFPSSAPRPVA